MAMRPIPSINSCTEHLLCAVLLSALSTGLLKAGRTQPLPEVSSQSWFEASERWPRATLNDHLLETPPSDPPPHTLFLKACATH